VAQSTTTTTTIELLGGIGNYVWIDTDLDGMQDPDEDPFPGAVVRLYDGVTGELLGSQVTGADGYYYFGDLPAGVYFVEFLSPGGSFIFTEALAGDNELDSDAQLGNTFVSLAPGEENLSIDAGLITRASSIVEVLPIQITPQVLPSTGVDAGQIAIVALTLLALGLGLLRFHHYLEPEM
jgi:hypothetical protein